MAETYKQWKERSSDEMVAADPSALFDVHLCTSRGCESHTVTGAVARLLFTHPHVTSYGADRAREAEGRAKAGSEDLEDALQGLNVALLRLVAAALGAKT